MKWKVLIAFCSLSAELLLSCAVASEIWSNVQPCSSDKTQLVCISDNKSKTKQTYICLMELCIPHSRELTNIFVPYIFGVGM